MTSRVRRIVATILILGMTVASSTTISSCTKSSTIQGVVTTPDGKPVAGAVVEIDGRSVTTDSTGRYIIQDAPLGEKVIEVRAPGNSVIKRPITIKEGEGIVRFDVAMTPLPSSSLTLNLTTSVSPIGSGTVSPSSGRYDAGASVTLTATPATGYHFVSWSGDVPGTGPTATITLDSNKYVIANFSINRYTLTASVSPSGGGTVNPSSGTYDVGASVTLTATPATGYIFDRWSGTDDDSINPTKVTMTEDKNVTVNFKTPTFGVKITGPLDNTVVSQMIAVRGTATSEVPKTQYLWIFVQYGKEVWPQTYRVTPVFNSTTRTYEWFVQAQVGMPNDVGMTFGIVALLVPQSVDADFITWFDTGKRTGRWPGFDVGTILARGAVILDTVSVKRD